MQDYHIYEIFATSSLLFDTVFLYLYFLSIQGRVHTYTILDT